MKFISAVLISVFLFGCASGTALVTGVEREPIDEAQVKIYLEAPETYEVVGIIEAFSEAGTTKKKKQNHAEKKLKKLAAEIGANGIIVRSVEEKEIIELVSDPDHRYTTNIKLRITVSGEAIYVPN
jgi:hypothetical protein